MVSYKSIQMPFTGLCDTPTHFSVYGKEKKGERNPMNKTETIEKYAIHEGDTGSPEVQIALLTERINHLNEHLKLHQKDRITSYNVCYTKLLRVCEGRIQERLNAIGDD